MIGIDEVGRGAWAGPLLVVVAREVSPLPAGLKDSKVLSKIQRQKIYQALSGTCEFGEGWVAPAEIDRLGLTQSMRLATKRALDSLSAKSDEKIIFDGNINYCDDNFYKASAVIDADVLFPIVSAASIYAKVTRDTYMASLPIRYSPYEFGKHVGYGTALHAEALKLHGLCDLHRRSFAPIKAYIV